MTSLAELNKKKHILVLIINYPKNAKIVLRHNLLTNHNKLLSANENRIIRHRLD